MQYVPALMLLGFDRPSAAKSSHPTFAGTWSARFEDVSGVHSAFTRVPEAALHIPNLDGPASLVVMCTHWSGILEIAAGDERIEFDSYAPAHTVREVAIPGSGVRNVTVSVLDKKHPDSQDHEIWIHRLAVDRHQPWLDRVTRLTPTLEVVNGDFGTFMTMRQDVGISHAIKTYGSWGPEQVQMFRKLVKPGTVAIDVGANIGHHTVVMSKQVGPAGQVLAFEPQQLVHRVLESNLALNQCANARAYRCALGAADGEATMAPLDYEHEAWNVGGLGISTRGGELDAAAGGQVVKVMRLDDVAAGLDVDFIKCDAQGFDYEVLKGAQALLARCKPIIVVEVAPLAMLGGTGVYLEMYAMLERLGYLLLDPSRPDPKQAPRRWSGVPEEWDVLAMQPHHLERLR